MKRVRSAWGREERQARASFSDVAIEASAWATASALASLSAHAAWHAVNERSLL